MSFFNSLQQYVTSGVAGLGLSPRRFSLSRQESAEPPTQPPPPPAQTERRESNNSQHHGELQLILLALMVHSTSQHHNIKTSKQIPSLIRKSQNEMQTLRRIKIFNYLVHKFYFVNHRKILSMEST